MAVTPRRAALLGLAGLLLAVPLLAASPEDASPFVHRPRFDRLTIDDGLSQSIVLAILQDRRGFLWLGTQDGLNRYDGYRFEIFKPDPARPGDSLASGYVHCLFEDSTGSLWVGTNRGLSRFDPATETFTTYRADPGQPDRLAHRQVFALTEDDDGFLWVATGGGLSRLPIRAPGGGAAFESFYPDADDPTSPSLGMLLALLVDSDGYLWTGSSTAGLARARPDVPLVFERFRSLPTDYVRALHEDAVGRVWVGTGDGLCRFDGDAAFDCLSQPTVWSLTSDREDRLWVGTESGLHRRGDDGSFQGFTARPRDPGTLENDFVNALHADASGVLWIGTDAGAERLDTAAKAFRHLFGGYAVYAVLRDRQGTLWVGTSEGLFADPSSSSWLHFRHDDGDRRSLSHDVVWSLYEDRTGNLWVGTNGGGLNFVDHRQLDGPPGRNLRFRQYRRDTADPTSLGDNDVTGILEDTVGNLWVATSGGGLNRFQPASGTFVRHVHDPRDPDSLPDDNVVVILEDRGGELWLGTHGGLSRFDGAASGRETERFTSYRHRDGEASSLSEDRVLTLSETRDGTLWIGTTGGLNRFDRAAGTFTSFTEHDGLPNNVIYAVAEDADGRLWLPTNRGLSRLDPTTGEVRSFAAADGLQSNEFNFRCSFSGDDGDFYFGGVNGLTVFRPGEIRDNPHAPPVVLTSFKVFNREVDLPRPISRLDRLELSHRDDVISFEFAALSFNDPARNRYAYKLEGFDKEWNEIGHLRDATYTNLDPGDYVFRVKASNNDGRWNDEGTALELVITPPFWQTWWFRTLGLAVAALALGAGHRTRTRIIKARNRELEDLVGERTRDLRRYAEALEAHSRDLEAANVRIRELDRTKSEFLARMSHELRTPLNSIIGFSELLTARLGEQLEGRYGSFLKNIVNSGHHLLNLINNVLDISKIEAGKMEVHLEEADVWRVAEGVQSVMAGIAAGRGITIESSVEGELPVAVLDVQKLRQMLFNLLSNAVKFSPDGTTVEVGIRRVAAAESPLDRDTLEIAVADQGIGIQPEDQERVFEEFIQVDSGEARSHGGTGLGLAIVRRFAEIQGGRVELESVPEVGSTFRVLLPSRVPQSLAGAVDTGDDDSFSGEFKRPTVLVVDDEEESFAALAEVLESEGYRPVRARHGEEAVSMARSLHPSVIALDLDLPGLDGWAAFKALKADSETSEIPVVIVSMLDNRELGLALGVDDYFLKPVDHDDFVDRIRGLAPPQGEGSRPVLVIDDDPKILDLVSEWLTPLGYRVECAANGQRGLELAAVIEPALIVLDLMMPELSGFQVAEALTRNRRTSTIPIVILTSKDLNRDERELLAGKIGHVLAKGSTASAELVATIRALEGRRRR